MKSNHKRCFKCNKVLPLSEFYKLQRMADGHLNKCKTCTKKDVAANYKKNKKHYQRYETERFQRPERKAKLMEYQKTMRMKNPEKYAARYAVQNAIRAGRLTREPCEVCGDTKSQAHHEDYDKPLEVNWLCFQHHRERHGQQF